VEQAILGESEPTKGDPGEGREEAGRPSGSRRARAVAAMVELAGSDGYVAVDVQRVAARAGLGTADFHRVFETLDDCLLAAFDEGAERVAERALKAAVEGAERSATDGAAGGDPAGNDGDSGNGAGPELVLRAMLGAVAGCVAAEPRLARVCLVEIAALGERGIERRQALLDRLRRVLEEQLARVGPPPRRLACELIVGGVHEVLARRVRGGDCERVGELAPSLAAIWIPLVRGG
jgi:AcrR family transcriptional regulator